MDLRKEWKLTCAVAVAVVFLLPSAAMPQQAAWKEAEPTSAIDLAGNRDQTIEQLVRSFYKQRESVAAWLSSDGEISGQAWSLIETLRGSDRDGLEPAAYDPDALEHALHRFQDDPSFTPADAGRLDMQITRTCFRFALDMLRGRVEPVTIDRGWEVQPRAADLVAGLSRSLQHRRVRETLLALAPSHPEYRQLREALARYRDLARQEWPLVVGGPSFEESKSYDLERVRALERRLQIEGYLVRPGLLTRALSKVGILGEEVNEETLYDARLAEAVRRFQDTHGILEDGVVGPHTLAELNRSPEEIVRRIELNMERWRWLPADLGARHVRVNVPAFELGLYEDGRKTLEMKIVVGRASWGTPLFSDRIEYIVLNPYWNVPESITAEELQPKIAEDPTFLEVNEYEVVDGHGDDAPVVDPHEIDWSEAASEDFPYRLRRRPGANNPLGRIKFMLPNRHNVYLHDTSQSELFDRTDRAFSHGCIRLERPIDLALELFRGDAKWNRTRFESELSRGEEQAVRLPQPVPVHMLYWTAFVNPAGELETHQDIYEIDVRLDAALATRGCASVVGPSARDRLPSDRPACY